LRNKRNDFSALNDARDAGQNWNLAELDRITVSAEPMATSVLHGNTTPTSLVARPMQRPL
jgi:hypothetical protein